MQTRCVEHIRERLNDVVCLHRVSFANIDKTLNPQTLLGGFFYVLATQLFTHAKKRLERAFIAFGGHILAQSADGFIQRIYF
jgi:hypothetical protein